MYDEAEIATQVINYEQSYNSYTLKMYHCAGNNNQLTILPIILLYSWSV